MLIYKNDKLAKGRDAKFPRTELGSRSRYLMYQKMSVIGIKNRNGDREVVFWT